ncbi:MAG: Fur family transcriptional regulator [Pseudomonadota bacterium]
MIKTAEKEALAVAPISAHWRSLAEERCKTLGERLTAARLGAYAELLAGKRALSAYDLIDKLEKRQDRKIAPLTVYRHLDFLTRVGLVHRIESTQSYLPCDHPQHPHESQYLLCTECGSVEEVHSKKLESTLDRIVDAHNFSPARAIIEVTGVCQDCQ